VLSQEQSDALRQVVEKAESAARDGSGEASRVLAILAATGMGLPHDLKAALHHLQDAAERGHGPAQAELAALAGNWLLADEILSGRKERSEAWGRLRAAVDISAWLRIPQAAEISREPRIAVVDGFISTQACDWLIRVAGPHLKQAQIFDNPTGGRRDDGRRNNSAAELHLSCMDTVVAFLRARIAALAEVPIAWLNAESCQIMHYRPGEEFVPHYDFLDVSYAGLAHDVASNGQRAMTLLVYLNEEYENGQTAFPLLERSFRGRKGDALFFWNVTHDGAPDQRTLHAGTPPTSGEKWLLSQWIRRRGVASAIG
jgi:prolyl 4-hydroxylase